MAPFPPYLDGMTARSNYLAGVPCWIDVLQPDPEATETFYGGLFGWEFERRTPPGLPKRYSYARLDGQTVGGVGGPPGEGEPTDWTAYVSVTSADETVARVEAAGGKVLLPPVDIPRSGRVALCADPAGAVFGLWQPGELAGADLVNAPGSWNFSELHVADADEASRFYDAVFGWRADPFDIGEGDTTMIFRLPGYGDHLAELFPEHWAGRDADPAMKAFSDTVAILLPDGDAEGRWTTTFSVGDADAAFARATELGARIVTEPFDTAYTRQGTIEDPQGTLVNLSEYRPPTPSDLSR